MPWNFATRSDRALSSQEMPGGPCLRCMGIIDDRSIVLEAQMYGAAGGRAQVVWWNVPPCGWVFSAALHALAEAPEFAGLLELEGNAQIVLPSNKLLYLVSPCLTSCSPLPHASKPLVLSGRGSAKSVSPEKCAHARFSVSPCRRLPSSSPRSLP